MFENSEYFEAILHYGTISKAASVLGISQPALSNYLKQVETKAGATLFDRSASPLLLTEAGKIFYRYMKQVEAVKLNYANEMDDLEKNGRNVITIGGASSTTACYLSKVTADFMKKYPDCSIRIIDGVVSGIARQTLNDEIDFFITPEKNREVEFEYIKLLSERLFLCAPRHMVEELSMKNEAWAAELKEKEVPAGYFDGSIREAVDLQPVDATVFTDCRFILLEEGTNVRAISNRLFDRWNYDPENPVEVSQMMTGFHLCMGGAGITFLPESILKYGSFKEYPAIYALEENIASRSMYVCYKKSRYMSACCNAYIEMLKNYFDRQ